MTDFGFAKIFAPEKGLTEILGSPLYMAPEILLKQPYGTPVDIWAAGVLFHIIMVGEPPFMAETKKEIFDMIRKRDVSFKEPGWAKLSSRCKSLVMSMLQKDPNKRLSAEKLLQHPWFDIIKT